MNDTTVTTLDDETPAEKPTKAAKVEKAKPNQAMADAGITGSRKSITIFTGEGDAGREDVFVGVNGFSFKIKRGKPVEVPVEVVEVLNNAVTTKYENGEAIHIPRYAFAVHN
mgnify:CR=1 FL=1